MSGKCQGILEFQMKFRFSNKKNRRREILKMARAVFLTVWVMLNYSDSFQILLSERKLKGLAPLVSSAAFCILCIDIFHIQPKKKKKIALLPSVELMGGLGWL